MNAVCTLTNGPASLAMTFFDPASTTRGDDEGWLPCAVSVRCGHFSGSVPGSLLVQELAQMRKQLGELLSNKAREIAFIATEEFVEFRILASTRGTYTVNVVVVTTDDLQVRLAFDIVDVGPADLEAFERGVARVLRSSSRL